MTSIDGGEFGALVPPLSNPAPVSNDEAFVVRATASKEEGERRIKEAILESYFRPVDIKEAGIEPTRLLWIPLWRIEMSADSFHLGLSSIGTQKGVLPTGGMRFQKQIALILARRLLPFDPSKNLKLKIEDMEPRSEVRRGEGEIIGPDLIREDAEKIATQRIKSSISPTSALYQKINVEILSRAFVYYPIWFSRYRYSGQAIAGTAPDECHVAVSARTGKVVSERHPSAFRSVAGRIKRIFE